MKPSRPALGQVKDTTPGAMDLRVHEIDREESLLLNAEKFANIHEGDIVEIKSVDKTSHTLIIQVTRGCFSGRGIASVSLLRPIADQFKLTNKSVTVLKVEKKDVTASHVNLYLKDQYISRGDIWLLKLSLDSKCLISGGTVSLDSIKAEVESITIHGKESMCGLVDHSTHFIFRSCSADIVWLVQMSKEMWEFGAEGQQHHVLTTQSMRDILHAWTETKVSHRLSVILFSRHFLNLPKLPTPQQETSRGPTTNSPSSPVSAAAQQQQRGLENGGMEFVNQFVKSDDLGRCYVDMYCMLLHNQVVASDSWPSLLVPIKRGMATYRLEVEAFISNINKPAAAPPGTGLTRTVSSSTLKSVRTPAAQNISVAPLLPNQKMRSNQNQFSRQSDAKLTTEGCWSVAMESNLLEAINLAANICGQHHLDKDLSRSAQQITVFTAGQGVLVCNDLLAQHSHGRFVENFNIDIISVARPALHSTPLFVHRQVALCPPNPSPPPLSAFLSAPSSVPATIGPVERKLFQNDAVLLATPSWCSFGYFGAVQASLGSQLLGVGSSVIPIMHGHTVSALITRGSKQIHLPADTYIGAKGRVSISRNNSFSTDDGEILFHENCLSARFYDEYDASVFFGLVEPPTSSHLPTTTFSIDSPRLDALASPTIRPVSANFAQLQDSTKSQLSDQAPDQQPLFHRRATSEVPNNTKSSQAGAHGLLPPAPVPLDPFGKPLRSKVIAGPAAPVQPTAGQIQSAEPTTQITIQEDYFALNSNPGAAQQSTAQTPLPNATQTGVPGLKLPPATPLTTFPAPKNQGPAVSKTRMEEPSISGQTQNAMPTSSLRSPPKDESILITAATPTQQQQQGFGRSASSGNFNLPPTATDKTRVFAVPSTVISPTRVTSPTLQPARSLFMSAPRTANIKTSNSSDELAHTAAPTSTNTSPSGSTTSTFTPEATSSLRAVVSFGNLATARSTTIQTAFKSELDQGGAGRVGAHIRQLRSDGDLSTDDEGDKTLVRETTSALYNPFQQLTPHTTLSQWKHHLEYRKDMFNSKEMSVNTLYWKSLCLPAVFPIANDDSYKQNANHREYNNLTSFAPGFEDKYQNNISNLLKEMVYQRLVKGYQFVFDQTTTLQPQTSAVRAGHRLDSTTKFVLRSGRFHNILEVDQSGMAIQVKRFQDTNARAEAQSVLAADMTDRYLLLTLAPLTTVAKQPTSKTKQTQLTAPSVPKSSTTTTVSSATPSTAPAPSAPTTQAPTPAPSPYPYFTAKQSRIEFGRWNHSIWNNLDEMLAGHTHDFSEHPNVAAKSIRFAVVPPPFSSYSQVTQSTAPATPVTPSPSAAGGLTNIQLSEELSTGNSKLDEHTLNFMKFWTTVLRRACAEGDVLQGDNNKSTTQPCMTTEESQRGMGNNGIVVFSHQPAIASTKSTFGMRDCLRVEFSGLSRYQWLSLEHDVMFHPTRCFHIQLVWLVCGSPQVDTFVQFLTWRAKSSGIHLEQIPTQPFPCQHPFLGEFRVCSFHPHIARLLVNEHGFVVDEQTAAFTQLVHYQHAWAFIRINETDVFWVWNSLLPTDQLCTPEAQALFFEVVQRLKEFQDSRHPTPLAGE